MQDTKKVFVGGISRETTGGQWKLGKESVKCFHFFFHLSSHSVRILSRSLRLFFLRRKLGRIFLTVRKGGGCCHPAGRGGGNREGLCLHHVPGWGWSHQRPGSAAGCAHCGWQTGELPFFRFFSEFDLAIKCDWLIDWPIDWLINRMTDWLIDQSIDWLTEWLIDWLIDWFQLLWVTFPGGCEALPWSASTNRNAAEEFCRESFEQQSLINEQFKPNSTNLFPALEHS